MRGFTFGIFALLGILVISCGRGGAKRTVREGDVQAGDTLALSVKTIGRFPDTIYLAPENLTWRVSILDSALNGPLDYLEDPYPELDGVYTFRGNHARNMPAGQVHGIPSEIVKEWEFQTESDTTHTDFGVWYGGSGWTGQPAFVHWSDTMAAQFRALSPGLTANFSRDEIIFGSLCRKVYFLNFDTGRPSRREIYAGNVIKGSVSVDPQFANVYVGQGVPIEEFFGSFVIDLLNHTVSQKFGRDASAWRSWGAYDSSPVVAGGFLFWPGENGTIYKFARSQGQLHPVASLRYRQAGSWGAAGVESSLAVCRNYGYFADNRGIIMCINLDTMSPVWCYDNHDDTDATVVLDVAGGVPYLYTCSEVDRQGNSGEACMVALNGLNGEEVWKTEFQCNKAFRGEKSSDGGMYSTPVLGSGDCSHLLFTTICDHNPAFHGKAVAIDRSDGRIVWEHSLKHYAWSSPVAFLNEDGKMFLFQGDCTGNVYLLDGLTGERLFTNHVANNFESSPVVVGDCVVVGSRGNTIYKFRIR